LIENTELLVHELAICKNKIEGLAEIFQSIEEP
jgi:hypothetical protein